MQRTSITNSDCTSLDQLHVIREWHVTTRSDSRLAPVRVIRPGECGDCYIPSQPYATPSANMTIPGADQVATPIYTSPRPEFEPPEADTQGSNRHDSLPKRRQGQATNLGPPPTAPWLGEAHNPSLSAFHRITSMTTHAWQLDRVWIGLNVEANGRIHSVEDSNGMPAASDKRLPPNASLWHPCARYLAKKETRQRTKFAEAPPVLGRGKLPV